MNTQTDQSKYSRISGGFHQYHTYDDSTVVIPKRNLLLPSIYEINSDHHFPNGPILDDIIYGDMHNDCNSSEADQAYLHNSSIQKSEDNENANIKTIKVEEEFSKQSQISQSMPIVQYNQQFEYTQHPINDIPAYQYCTTSYNTNDMQYMNNKNPDPRCFIQYQIPYNSMFTQISEDINSPFMDKSNLIESHPQNLQSTKLNFLSLPNRIEDAARIILDPVELKFIPADQWTKGKITLDNLKKDFFCARSSKCLRFEYKLWNALQITKHYPYLFNEIGVRWIAKSFIMVHRDIFGHLLQVTRPSAALFSSCGMFMTHGFREIMLSEVRNSLDPRDISSIDESIVRLFTHKANDFNEDSSSADIIKIKWNNESRKRAEKW